MFTAAVDIVTVASPVPAHHDLIRMLAGSDIGRVVGALRVGHALTQVERLDATGER